MMISIKLALITLLSAIFFIVLGFILYRLDIIDVDFFEFTDRKTKIRSWLYYTFAMCVVIVLLGSCMVIERDFYYGNQYDIEKMIEDYNIKIVEIHTTDNPHRVDKIVYERFFDWTSWKVERYVYKEPATDKYKLNETNNLSGKK